jgi:Family of unknown function (DUF5985)
MATAVYFLCAVTSALCALLLIREYFRHHSRLLLWSSLSFTALAVSNAVVFTDFVVYPDLDLSLLRLGAACLAVALLLFGLVWEAE